jgi:hypothetical protein
MAISSSLSEDAINEFASRVASDQELPASLKVQITTLIEMGKWKRDVSVSDALATFHEQLEGKIND